MSTTNMIKFFWGIGELYREWLSIPIGQRAKGQLSLAVKTYFKDHINQMCEATGLTLLDFMKYLDFVEVQKYKETFLYSFLNHMPIDGYKKPGIMLVIPFGLASLTGSQLTPFQMVHDLYEVLISKHFEMVDKGYQGLQEEEVYTYPEAVEVLQEMRMLLTDDEGKWTVLPRVKHVMRWLKTFKNMSAEEIAAIPIRLDEKPIQKAKYFLINYLKSPFNNIDSLSELLALWAMRYKFKTSDFIVVSETRLAEKFPTFASSQSVDVEALIERLKPLANDLFRLIVTKYGVVTAHPKSYLAGYEPK